MERRQHERSNIEPLEIVIEEVECSSRKYEQVTIIIEDVSLEGLRFSTNIEFIMEEILHFHLPSIDVASLVTGKISWKTRINPDRYQYGLHILNGSGSESGSLGVPE